MRKSMFAVLPALLVLTAAFAQQQPETVAQTQPKPAAKLALDDASASQARLPVKRVVLYKNGVGYFEHTARVHGTQELGIDFTTAQLNDVIKSLTVVDLGEGHVSGVRYNSVASLNDRLKNLRLPLGEVTTQADFLGALRGVPVEVRSGGVNASGKVLSIENVKRQTGKGDQVVEVTQLSLVTEGGELRTFELGPTTSVRIIDHDASREVGRYLNLIGSANGRDLRHVTISATGTGDRDIFVSYISEVPVWKSTYRILLPSKPGEKALLQGWAIVDNTGGDDWKDVHLSLVAGSPQSFVQQISQPYYARRPELPLPQFAMLTPQTHEGTMGAGEGTGVGGGVIGVVGGVPGGMPATPPPPPPSPPQAAPRESAPSIGVAQVSGLSMTGRSYMNSVLAQRQHAEAEGKEIGELFEYDLNQKVTIDRNQSALVPIIQSHIDAEKVTLWNEDTDAALRALWITNSSGETLDSGTFNISEADTFAGEGVLDAVRQGEKRLISYAADPAVRVAADEDSSEKPVSHVVIAKGVMVMTREQRATKKYAIHNSDKSPRQVIIEHPAREGWKLAGGAKPEETSASFHRFRVPVEAGKTAELRVEEFHPLDTRVELTDLSSDEITLLVDQKRLTPALDQAFRKILGQKNQISSLDAEMKTRQQEIDSIAGDQGRIRENMKALKGSAEEKTLLQRYTQQLNTQEDRLATLRSENAGLKAKRQQAEKDLDQMLQTLTLDETF
jgi:hypothetical protein